MQITVLMKNRSNPDTPNIVNVFSVDSKVFILCNCDSGRHGGYCYHKEALFNDDVSLVYDKEQLGPFSNAVAMIAGTELKAMYESFQDAEAAAFDARNRAKRMKDKLTRAMMTRISQ